MTNDQILKKAIEKAIRNGMTKTWNMEFANPIVIIFDHDFAKAFWGEESATTDRFSTSYDLRKWQYHLQTMVLEEDPIKYLERFLE